MRRPKPGAICRTGPEFACWAFDGSDPMHLTLFTLGYDGLTIDAFIARLQAAQVKTVVDVRELPLSRKKGFSKTAFCTALATHGIAYLHPPPWVAVRRSQKGQVLKYNKTKLPGY